MLSSVSSKLRLNLCNFELQAVRNAKAHPKLFDQFTTSAVCLPPLGSWEPLPRDTTRSCGWAALVALCGLLLFQETYRPGGLTFLAVVASLTKKKGRVLSL